VVNVTKNIFKIKSSKVKVGIIAKVITALILIYGGYQIYSSNFSARIQGLGIVFNITQPGQPPVGVKRRPDSSGISNNNPGKLPSRLEGAPEGGGFKSPSALDIIVTYFGIMGVFIILTYYLEKIGISKKRRATEVN
jgi:hypothetical protein